MENYSVLMSVYKKEKAEFLKQSCESIFAQTHLTDDFVLVCDGPLTDELDAVIFDMQKAHPEILNVLRFDQNRGLGPALNDGLATCKNRLVARMDSDDIAPEYRCELQLDAFSKNEKLTIIGGAIEEFEGSVENILSKKPMPQTNDEIYSYARRRCPFNHPTVMYDRDFVLKVGGYPDIPLHEDYGLWINLLKAGAMAQNINKTLCFMRVDSGLYGRRGGFKYLKTALKFRYHIYRLGFSSFIDMIYTCLALMLVCVVPTSLRKSIYKKFLRRK